MIKIISILLFLYGTFSFYAVISGQGYLPIFGAVLSLVAAIGLWLRRTWSQYLVYALSIGFVAEWIWLVSYSVQQKSWPYSDLTQSIISLFPGLCLVVLVVSVSVVVFRSFRVQR